MSGVFSIVSDGANGLFRMRQATRAWDEDGKLSTLKEKAEEGNQAFALDPEFLRGAQSAMAAMEEARRIAGPKGVAEDRIAQAEKRLKEIRQEARMAAARGDRERLTALAREASQLARQAGRAAQEYGVGISAAAVMGVGGETDRAGGTGGFLSATSSIGVQVSTATLQVRQVEISVTLTIKGDGAENAGVAAQVAVASAGTAAGAGSGTAGESGPAEPGPAEPDAATSDAGESGAAAEASGFSGASDASSSDASSSEGQGASAATTAAAKEREDKRRRDVEERLRSLSGAFGSDWNLWDAETAGSDFPATGSGVDFGVDFGTGFGAGSGADAAVGFDGEGLAASLGLRSEINLDGLAERVGADLASSGQALGGFNGAEGKRLLAAMIQENELKASRYREADGFARRVETALHDAKAVIGEAKAANMNEPDSRRRAERRKELNEMDEDVQSGFEATSGLRAAAFGGMDPGALAAAAGVEGGGVAASAPVAIAAPSVNITA